MSDALYNFFLQNERPCYKLLHTMNAPQGSLLHGTYSVDKKNNQICGVLAVYENGLCYAFIPDVQAVLPLAHALRGQKIRLLEGSPAHNIRALHEHAFPHRPYTLSQESIMITVDKAPHFPVRDGLTLTRLDASDEAGFACAAEIYSKAHDEHLTGTQYQRLSREMINGEGVYLLYDGNTPCATLCVQAQTVHYRYIGSIAVQQGLYGCGYGTYLLSNVCAQAVTDGYTALSVVGNNNASSLHIYQKCGSQPRETFQFIWYD